MLIRGDAHTFRDSKAEGKTDVFVFLSVEWGDPLLLIPVQIPARMGAKIFGEFKTAVGEHVAKGKQNLFRDRAGASLDELTRRSTDNMCHTQV